MKTIRLKKIANIHSIFNIVGIAIATAAFYVLMSVVDFDLTFNHDIDDYENIYELSLTDIDGQRYNNLSRALGEAVGTQIPSITSYGCLSPMANEALYIQRNGEYNKIEKRVDAISKGFLNTFGFKIVDGDTSRFDGMDKLIVSRRIASTFNLRVGDVFKPDLNSNDELELVAIYEDFKKNNELRSAECFKCLGDKDIDDPYNGTYTFYYKTPSDFCNIVSSYQDIIIDIIKSMPPGIDMTDEEVSLLLENSGITIYPLDLLRFAPDMKGHRECTDPKIVYTLMILAIVIIAIAYINYLNFFVARMPQHIKSINTKKILGQKRSAIVASLTCEALIFTLIALALAYLIVWKIVPTVLDGAITVSDVLPNYKILAITIVAAIATSINVSIFPALHFTNIPPSIALKGKITQNKDSILRYILIGFQITASTALIIVSIFIHKNTEYIAERDLGFDTHNLLGVETSSHIAAQRETARSILLRNPDIADITWAHSEIIAAQRFNATFYTSRDNKEAIYSELYFVSDNFLKFMDIHITDGRDFMPSDHMAETGIYLFNETAYKKYNLTSQQSFPSFYNGKCEIIGFCNDFNFKPLRYEITPLAFFIPGKDTPNYMELRHLYIRFVDGADAKQVSQYVDKTLAEVDPDFPIMQHDVKSFQREVMSSNYAEEEQLTCLVTIFAVIAILLSIMGVFGIVLFEAERRRKEIGIRRVNGATVWAILGIFNRKFLIITTICSATAAPLSYWATNKYLSGFAYHYGINLWPFVVGILTVMVITSIIVTAASFKAANENPIDTLKTE